MKKGRSRRDVLLGSAASIAASGLGASNVAQAQRSAGERLPRPKPPFGGTIAPDYRNAHEDFPRPVRPPQGAPNVVLIMLDDVGFGQAGTFGGPVPTPNIDKLAAQGLRYNQFHTTAICSPTRAALLTGRNHHQCGTGTIMELSTGFPGYDSVWGKDVASVAEVLRQNGYATAAWGKWHNTPDWETSPIGPFERWPTGQGFEYFYGFQGGETSQWEPQLFRNTVPVEPPRKPEHGYHLTEDITDDAITWVSRLKSIAPDKPYFLYFAPGAAHAPHHVPKEWIDRFNGQFDRGWDRMRDESLARQKKLGVVPADTSLTRRPAEIEAWDSLSPDARRLYARQMEVFAGFLAHTDHHVGRLLDAIGALPDAENTLVIYIVGDNGASAEGSLTGTTNNVMTQNGVSDDVDSQLPLIDELGGPKHENHFAVGWSWAGAAPFAWMKRVPSHLGGTRNGMVVAWPKRIADRGGLRMQFHHCIDIAPTIYEVTGVRFPETINGLAQVPIAGVSMAYSFDQPDAPSTRKTQYFEVGGHRAIYHEGWLASARHGVPWVLTGSTPFDQDKWELYDLTKDFSQANDLAAANPQRLKELQAIFDQEARRFNVYPLDDRFAERVVNPNRPSVTRDRSSFTYAAGTTRIPEGSAPPVYRRSHRIVADIELPQEGAEGVIVATGGSAAGYTLYVKDRRLVYEYNFFGKNRYIIASDRPLPTGKVQVVFDYEQGQGKEPTSGGIGKLYVNGQPVGEGRIDRVVPSRFSATETLDIGMDLGATVAETYQAQAPFAFTGKIARVTIELKPEGAIGRALK
jgi:arylsulfatase A-like enzyme